MTTPHVFTAICAVMTDIGVTGISKNRKNQQQGYQFRGIDDVYNELNSLLSKHKLVMTPRILSRSVVERQTMKGGALFYVTVEAEFDFISAEDGSKHTVRTFGEAMDSADKATNKAMSAAYKYAAMMVFCIPTEGDNDADAVTHDVAGKQPAAELRPDFGLDGRGYPARVQKEVAKAKPISAAEQKRQLAQIDQDLLDCHSMADVNKCAEIWKVIAGRDGWSKDYKIAAADKFGAARKRFEVDDDPADIFPGDAPTLNSYTDNYMAG